MAAEQRNSESEGARHVGVWGGAAGTGGTAGAKALRLVRRGVFESHREGQGA